MTAVTPSPATMPFEVSGWSDSSSRAILQLIAESAAQMVGFEVAVISAVQGDTLVSVAIEGNDDVRRALETMRTPMDNIWAELALAEDWGRFKFIDHEVTDPEDQYRWVPDLVPGTGPDAWHPLDSLLAPLYTETGELCGLLSIDLPTSGRRPDPTQLHLLERYAAQAERALINAFERDELEQRVRLTGAAREIVRVAVSQPDLEAALAECRPVLLSGFRADDLSIRTYPAQGCDTVGPSHPGVTVHLRQLLRGFARSCWEHQRVGLLLQGSRDPELISQPDFDRCLALLDKLGNQSSMVVPIGVGSQCFGHVILFRADAGVAWTPDERTGALGMTRDIGHAILASRNLEREQRLVRDLQELDTYKTQLLSTVSHELKNPLGAVTGHLELIDAAPDLSVETRFSVEAMSRATTRITRVVEDLLTLAKLEDPESLETAAALDLRAALTAALENSAFAAEQRALTVRLEAPPGPIMVDGDADGLERIFTNLVGNAVKYARPGGSVDVRVAYREDDVTSGRELEIAVVDDGIGISAEDQGQLFTEFFRSTNPVALAEPGTGLGLAISTRIVERHGGRITVESILGSGSTFRVLLPAPQP